MKVLTIKEILEDLESEGLDSDLAMDYGTTIALLDEDSYTAGDVFGQNLIIALKMYQKRYNLSEQPINEFTQIVIEYSLK